MSRSLSTKRPVGRLSGQPWIHSAAVDGTFILMPAFAVTVFLLLNQDYFSSSTTQQSGMPPWVWLLLVVGIDVSHVYSTFYRIYLDPATTRKHWNFYFLLPLLGWVAGVMLYTLGSIHFWRALAYLAVFHFIRQQYGFLRIYSRRDPSELRRLNVIDSALIYFAALYPLAFWHTNLPRNFNWFIDGDFYSLALSPWFATIFGAIYGMLFLLYVCKEIYIWKTTHALNLPKNGIIFGTALSWYLGIVAFNGDLAFTAANVISHGIPYLALIWIYGQKKYEHEVDPGSPGVRSRLRPLFTFYGVPGFVAVLFIFGFIEEALWDGLVWKDHLSIFSWFSDLPRLEDSATLSWLIPLLAVPQLTHYLLDGFIWKVRTDHFSWRDLVIPDPNKETANVGFNTER